MATRSVFYIVTAAKRDDINLVCFALNLGPDTFSVPASATGNNPATHYYGHDGSQSAALAEVFGSFPDNSGTVPTISGTWGQDYTHDTITKTLPSEAQAKAALAACQVSVASNITGASHRDGILNGLSLQQIVPVL